MNPTYKSILRQISSLLLFWKNARWDRFDWISPLCMTVLGVFSVMYIYSSQVYNGGNLWLKQLIWIALGWAVYFLISSINYKKWMGFAHLFYILVIGLLLIVITPLGTEIYNARRWINIGPFSIQPSEIAKISTFILVARILSKHHFHSLIDSITALALVLIITLIPTLIIFIQPDLGSALIIPIMTFFVLYSAGFHKRFFAISLAAILLVISIVGFDLYRYEQFLKNNNLTALENRNEYREHSWVPLSDGQRNRLLTFIAPDRIDPQGLGVSWNVRQSRISVGTGGWDGKGWTKGTQAKLGYLPQTVAYNDFIFSVIAEESGFIGAVTVLLLFTVLMFNGIRIAHIANDRFGQILAIGVSVFLFIHVFVNVGMTMGITPVTGLPLPFLSQGGTFLLSCYTLLAIHQSIYRYREKI
ncbi:MAG: rod shape-determining protein RodA [Opitutales bacterium]|nr:rod shape-determining protein RodA [Opitutales bacterium]